MKLWHLILAVLLGSGLLWWERRTKAESIERPAAVEDRRFMSFVDAYLDQWALRHPSIAAGNGMHQHDDALEDFSAAAVAAEVQWLKESRARLDAIPRATLSPNALVDHKILAGVIDGWILELDGIKNHTRNPMLYASAIADGVHNLMTMESADAETRMHRITAKLSHVPALLDAARVNLANPPRALVERGITMFEGARDMLGTDLAIAFQGASGATRDAMLAQAKTTQIHLESMVQWLRRELLPRATGPIALGAPYVEARYRAEELIDAKVSDLLTIGMRELAREQALFVAKAREIDAERDPMEVWQEVRRQHPNQGELVSAAREAVEDLTRFVQQKNLATVPDGERVIVEPSRPFDLGLASMHASPPLESAPVKSIYYLTDANPAWPAERQNQWLERFNRASLSITTAHEAMPGHWLHSIYMRNTPGKVRKIWIGLNPFPQPSSGQDGWAHYAEQLVVEQGFHSDQPRYALAQLSESMTRICRLIAGLNVHSGKWTVDEAAAFFEASAHVPAQAARQEAVRVVYDPTNGGYFLGKHAMLKLRDDVQVKEGSAFSLRALHERVMRNGIAPWWAHRFLLLGDSAGAVVN